MNMLFLDLIPEGLNVCVGLVLYRINPSLVLSLERPIVVGMQNGFLATLIGGHFPRRMASTLMACLFI